MWLWLAIQVASTAGAEPAESAWVARPGPWGSATIRDAAPGRVLTDAGLWVDGVRVEGFAPRPGASQRLTWDGGVAWSDETRLCAWTPSGGERCVPTTTFPGPLADRWAGGLNGSLFEWDGAAWQQVQTPIPPGPESHVVQIAALADGSLWLGLNARSWWVRDPAGAWTSIPRPPGSDRAGAICEGPMAATGALHRWDGAAWVELLPAERGVFACGDGLAGGEGGRLWRIDGMAPVPTSTGHAIAGIRGGVAWTATELLEPGSDRVAFRDVAPAWQVADPGPSDDAWFVEADADPWPDLLIFRSGVLKLLRNTGAGRFEDRTAASGLGAERWTDPVVAACDLDGDGRQDLAAWDGSGMRWLRGVELGWEDVSDRGFDRTDVGAPVRDLDCVDLDGDGDPDLFASHGHGREDVRPWPPTILENTGHGRLRAAPAAFRGLAEGPTWEFRTLFADLTGDPAPEAVLLGSWSLGARILERAGDGSWRRGPALDASYGTLVDAVAGDFDGDGDRDLAILQPSHPRLALQRSGGFELAAGLPEPVPKLVGDGTRIRHGAAVADLDGDGRDELLLPTDQGVARVALDEAGRVRTRVDLPGLDLGPVPMLRAADVDRDGDLDLFLPSPDGPDRLLLDATEGPGASAPVATATSSPLARRLAWMRWDEAGGRLALGWAALALAAVLGRRRGYLGFGSALVVVLLALGAAAVELAISEGSVAVRWGAGLLGIPVVGLLFQADGALTRTVRATRIAGYRLEGALGSGGMATVHLARDGGRSIALKVLHPTLAEDQDARARFRREAELAARFRHPHLIEVYQAGECRVFRGDRPTHTLYLAMEYVDGPPLRGFLGSPLPVGQACRLLCDLLEVLALLHEGGVVHRDIKPENLLIRRDGCLKLADFGVAHGGASRTLTRTGHVIGTLAYMPPEQARGKPVDERADLYSVGVLAYEMLAGRRPFDSEEGVDLVYQLLMLEPEPLTGVEPALAQAIARCLAKDPEARWASARELLDALSPWADPAVDLRALGRAGRTASTADAPQSLPTAEATRG